MERFAIKIDKTVKSKLKNLCRLCGIDNPDQVDIFADEEEFILIDDDDEVPLSRKIFECVGIQCMKGDRMPQRVCSMCVDKINDFHEYRQMCIATNIQTRKLLSLPPKLPKKAPKKVTTKTDDKSAESIFGIVGEDSAIKIEPATKTTKTTKKTKKSSASVKMDESSIRSLTQQEIEMALKLEETKQEVDDDDWSANRPKSKRVKKPSAKSKATSLLLAPKELNQRERKREIEQKKIEKKRKCDDVKKTQPAKKVKREPIVDSTIQCTICGRNFANSVLFHDHNELDHLPTVAAFGCSSCQETFITAEEKAIHHKWHQTSRIPYKCILCAASIEKMITFHRHVAACTKALSASFVAMQNIDCNLCNFGFETQNLYEWHDCFIKKNAPCPKCGRVFTKKTILFKHLFKCNGTEASTSTAVVQIPKLTTNSKTRSTKSKTDIIPTFKLEPETIIETNLIDENNDNVFDDGYMDTHFGDSDDDYGMSNSITASTKAQIQVRDQNLQTSRAKKQKTSTTVGQKCSGTPIVVHKLADCVVKLEPIDISQYNVNVFESMQTTDDMKRTETTTTNDEVPVSIETTPPTVPPLTIRIKKEKINMGYGDFDAELARNIKKEKSDESWELVGGSSCGLGPQPNAVRQSVENKSKKSKSNTLYKKPALLAIKIKQERIEREVNEEEIYHDYSIPVVEMLENPTPTPSIENILPIITQIHSVLEPTLIQTNDQSRLLPNPFSTQQQNQLAEPIPFKPIRIIKQERLSPTLSKSLDQIPDNTFTEQTDTFTGIDQGSQSSEGDLHNCVSVATTESSTNSEDTPKPNETMNSDLGINCSSTQCVPNVSEENSRAKCDETNGSSLDTIVEHTEIDSSIADSKICESVTTANNSEPQINNSETLLDSNDRNDVKVISEAQQENIEINVSHLVSVNNPTFEANAEANSSELEVKPNDKTDVKVQSEQADISSQPNCNKVNEILEIDTNDINKQSDLNQSVIECENASNTDANIEAAICESGTTTNTPAPQNNDFESSFDSTDGNNMIQKDEDIFEALESGLIDADESLLLDENITEDSLLDSNSESLLLSKDVQILEAVKDVLSTAALDELNDGDSNLNFIDRLVDKAAEEIIGDDTNEHLEGLNHLIENTTPFNNSNGLETGIANSQPCTSTDSTNGNGMELLRLADKSADNHEILGLNIDYNELMPSVDDLATNYGCNE